MPGKNGFELLHEIRVKDRDLPVIMLSGASSPENIVEVMKKGATDFLGKPFSPEELHKVLKGAFEGRPAPAARLPRPSAPATKPRKLRLATGAPACRKCTRWRPPSAPPRLLR
jgi:DNA-binding response OmpR family regulator